ncbi:MAG: TetR/AcrR family transcriptional regulator [Kiloniellales bacterium]
MSRKSSVRPRQRRLKPDVRRQLLVDATLKCLAKYGPQGTGVRQVSRELKVAPSLINYFFEGRKELLTSAYHRLAERFMEELREIIDREHPTAHDRLRTIIEWYFSPEWRDDEVVGAYLALWALSRTELDLNEAFSRFHAERKELLTRVLDDVARERGASVDSDLLASCMLIFLDGLWLELSLNPSSSLGERALEMSWAWLDGFLVKPGSKRKRISGR